MKTSCECCAKGASGTDMANRIRRAMYDADFWMLEESDKGYNQPAYDPATRTYTVQWTWVYWQEALQNEIS